MKHGPAQRQRGAALLTAMVIVTLVATLAAAMVWQQWRAVQVEAAERARMQAAWILAGALDWARLILREDAPQRRRRPPRRTVGGAAGRGAPVDLPGRRQGQHRRRARRLPVGRHQRRPGALQPAQPLRRGNRQGRAGEADGADAAVRSRPGCRPTSPTGSPPRWPPPALGSSDAPLLPQSVAQLVWLGLDADTVQSPRALRGAAAGAHAGEPQHRVARSHRRQHRRPGHSATPSAWCRSASARLSRLSPRPRKQLPASARPRRRPGLGGLPLLRGARAACAWTTACLQERSLVERRNAEVVTVRRERLNLNDPAD